MTSTYPLVFSEFKTGRLRLKNRLLMTATVTNLAAGNRLTPEFIDFYRDIASGGVAAIITEGLSVHRTSVPNPRTPMLFKPEIQADLRKLTDSVHREGTQLYGQLWHVGRNALWGPGEVAWAPSALRDPYTGTLPHEMSLIEIRELRESFIEAAEVLVRSGFDGVELHGAHGYLLTQFLSPWSNVRNDEYGADINGRCRFIVEVIRGIRERCGSNFVVGIKLSGDEGIEGAIDPPLASKIVKHLVTVEAPDYICLSQGNFSRSLENHVPDSHFSPAPFEAIYNEIRPSLGNVPMLYVGRITGIDVAEEILNRGSADLIGMSRALVADAELPNKANSGFADRIRSCIYCNYCWNMIHHGQAITCIYNPLPGFNQWENNSVSEGVIRIIGAGPAGLQAALESKNGDRQVEIYDRSATVGGQLAGAEKIPGLGYLTQIIKFMDSELRSKKVPIHLSYEIDAQQISAWINHGDKIVLATGSQEIECPIPRNAQSKVTVKLMSEVIHSGVHEAENVLVVDISDNEPVYSFATYLSNQGANVTLISEGLEIGRRLPYTGVIGILRRLEDADVTVLTHTSAKEIGIENVIAQDTITGHQRAFENIDTVVFLGARMANDVLARELSDHGIEVPVIGDAYSPRGLGAAIRQAKIISLSL